MIVTARKNTKNAARKNTKNVARDLRRNAVGRTTVVNMKIRSRAMAVFTAY